MGCWESECRTFVLPRMLGMIYGVLRLHIPTSTLCTTVLLVYPYEHVLSKRGINREVNCTVSMRQNNGRRTSKVSADEVSHSSLERF